MLCKMCRTTFKNRFLLGTSYRISRYRYHREHNSEGVIKKEGGGLFYVNFAIFYI